MNAPDVSFRTMSAPFSAEVNILYAQSTLGGDWLPVKEGENSNIVGFRIYNNWGLTQSVATMFNVTLTVFDNVGIGSMLATKSSVTQSWIRIYESGFGENSQTPGLYTQYLGEDTAIGNAGGDSYAPEYGSNGASISQVRAGADKNGVGFIEFNTYAKIPSGASFANYTMAIAIEYDWSS